MKNKILIVDDDPTSLRSVESVLKSNGYEVKTSNKAEGIERLVQEFNPNVIVMDLMMPNVDGSQAVQKLQTNPVSNKIPVIFLTALQTRDENRNIEFEVNVNNRSYRTLAKPFDPKALIVEIETLLKV